VADPLGSGTAVVGDAVVGDADGCAEGPDDESSLQATSGASRSVVAASAVRLT
jgi:hypothetical protein